MHIYYFQRIIFFMGFYIRKLTFYPEVFIGWLKYYHACDSQGTVKKK